MRTWHSLVLDQRFSTKTTRPKLCNAVSELLTAATRDALAERLQGVRETTLLYNRMMEKLRYG